MSTKIVVTFAKRQKDDRETYRRIVLTTGRVIDWQVAAVRAKDRVCEGERIVSISEAGYQ